MTATSSPKPRIGIFYDTMTVMGGAERVIVLLANELEADIVTSGYNPDALAIKPRYPVHDIGNTTAKFSKAIAYVFEAPIRFFINRNKFDYDIIIYAGCSSIYAVRKNTRSIWYCFAPNRIIYDLREQKLAGQGFIGKLALWLHILLFSRWDQRSVRKFKRIIAQTKNIQARINRFYGLDSGLLYGPVDTDKYKQGEIGDYFLAVSRLFPEKRMGLIAKAFAGTKAKLVLVGDGPEKAKIAAMADANPNITLKSNLSDTELSKLYEDCRATVYMPVDEDYGLIPLEGMAAGKPCIAVNEGGCKETVQDNRTGFLVEPTVGDIRASVAKVTESWVAEHADACRARAEEFDLEHFVAGWRKVLNEESAE